MKKWKLFLITAIVVVLFAGAYFLYNILSEKFALDMLAENFNEPTETVSEHDDEKYKAPDFTVFKIDGTEVSLSDMTGKGIVVNFWASWCPPCKAEMPDFEELYQKYGNEVNFMMVNMTDGYQETVKSGSSHVESKGYTFPVYYDLYYSAARAYQVTSLPATYFIDKDGNLVTYAKGMINKNTLEKGIMLIK